MEEIENEKITVRLNQNLSTESVSTNTILTFKKFIPLLLTKSNN